MTKFTRDETTTKIPPDLLFFSLIFLTPETNLQSTDMETLHMPGTQQLPLDVDDLQSPLQPKPFCDFMVRLFLRYILKSPTAVSSGQPARLLPLGAFAWRCSRAVASTHGGEWPCCYTMEWPRGLLPLAGYKSLCIRLLFLSQLQVLIWNYY